MFAPLGFVPGLTPEQIEAVADPKRWRQANLPTLRHAIKAGTWLIGPPEEITERTSIPVWRSSTSASPSARPRP